MTDRDDHLEHPDDKVVPGAPDAVPTDPSEAQPAANADEPDAPAPPSADGGEADAAAGSEDAGGGTDEPRAETDDEPEPVAAASAGDRWRRMARAVFTPKLTAANTVIALLVGLLGFALIVQVRSNSNESTLANDRPDDLVRILSDLDARKDRLSTEISSLQTTVQQLNSGAQGRQAALDAAAKRADEIGILAGTLPATGPGLVIDLVPAASQQIPANTVLDTVEELRGAGGEAMQISGTGSGAVRIVASTYFTDVSGGINVDGTTMAGTLSITVIGDPQTIQAALSIPGGVVDTVRGDNGTVRVATPGTVRVTALHAPSALKYARPVS
jgi:uncharacterized protein YlxW (UPF0749 family)